MWENETMAGRMHISLDMEGISAEGVDLQIPGYRMQKCDKT